MKIIALLFLGLAVFGCRQSPPAESAPSSKTVTIDFGNTGTVRGTVSFSGVAPKLLAIDMTADPSCPQQPQSSDAVGVDHGKLANVFVYVKGGLPPGRFPVPPDPVVLDQKDCRYVPHMLGIMAGQPLKVTNSDVADHNVHAMPVSNRPWNESQPAKDPAILKTFDKPEMMVAMQCNQHPWMRAHVNVMDNPYYAVSAADGRFEIRNLPPGEYTLVAVHEKFGQQSAKVKVGPQESTKADFEFAAQP